VHINIELTSEFPSDPPGPPAGYWPLFPLYPDCTLVPVPPYPGLLFPAGLPYWAQTNDVKNTLDNRMRMA